MINPHIFRQYDIRGIVNKDFTPHDSALIARSILQFARESNIPLRTLVVGRDARAHSQEIFNHFTRACKNEGINIINIGVVTTPILYFTLHTTPYTHGVMITASHNPAEYNGFKICLNKKSISGKSIERIRDIVFNSEEIIHQNLPGNILPYDALTRYIQSIANDFSHLANKKYRILFDCNNGPAGLVMPEVIKKLGWKQCSVIHETLDGSFPNQKPDPTVETNNKTLKQMILKSAHPTIGISFDGDADRMAAHTEQGELIPGDYMLALLSKNVLHHFPGARVVFDIKSSNSLSQTIAKHGGIPVMSPTGHSNIKTTMSHNKALLGGELSGHFFFADKSYGYDDGIYAGMRLIEYLQEEQTTLHATLKTIPASVNSPELRIPCAEQDKATIIAKVATFFENNTNVKLITIDGLRIEASYGWGIIRASNTEPVLSLRFEGVDTHGLRSIKQDFLHILKTCMQEDILAKHF